MIQTSARLLALLSLLQMRREWSGPDLAERLEVGDRTIRRDIDKLRSLGYPIEAAPGIAGGYRLGVGADLPPLLLDDAEAVAVAVGLRSAAAGSIAGMEEAAVRTLAKLEQMLPDRLQRRVRALGDATSTFAADGPRIDPDQLATIAAAIRDAERLRFAYVAKDDAETRRFVEPAGIVHTGYRWYVVGWDLDREDWRTFRVDRIASAVTLAGRGTRREVPGGDAAAFVRQSLRGGDAAAPVRGAVRIAAPADIVRNRVPARYVTVEPDGSDACIVTTNGSWSSEFVVWMATLDHPFTVIGPPELAARCAAIAVNLGAAAPITE